MPDGLSSARLFVSWLPDAAVLLDASLRCVYYNEPFLRMTGLSSRRLERDLGSVDSVFSLLGNAKGKDREAAAACLQKQTAVHLAEVTVTNTSGEEFVVLQSFMPVTRDGDTVGLIASLRDMTAEVRMHRRYKELLGQERVRAEELERQVEERTRQVNLALEELKRLSRTDPLTGVLNRRAFTEFAEQAIELARRHDRCVAVLMCDLDHFKKLNDTFGHQAGDRVLAAAARNLDDIVRVSDKVARFGGEEFIVLLSETSRGAVEQIAERCRSQVQELPLAELVPDKTEPQTISIGAALFPEHGEDLDTLIGNADRALYRAKRGGRNRVAIYTPNAESDSVARRLAGGSRQQILLVDPCSDRVDAYLKQLGADYEVVVASAADDALAHCNHLPFDAVVADIDVDGGAGAAFMQTTLAVLPAAVRILLIDAADAYLAIRGNNAARVDYFMLRSDGADHLARAVGDGLARKELARQNLLRQSTMAAHAAVGDQVGAAIVRVVSQRALHCVYQPIISCRGGELFGFEALSRVADPLFADPGGLFDAAARLGSAWELGRVVRDTIATDLEIFGSEYQVFVNLHPTEMSDPVLLEGDPFLEQGAHRVIFEITERSAIPDLARFREYVTQLKEHGFRIAVDDLGAGYATLNSVALLEPEFVKIDMAMVRDIDSSSRKQRLVRTMVEFARSEGILVIAEGVETAGEAVAVRALGCDLMQGFGICRPLSAEQVAEGSWSSSLPCGQKKAV